MELVVSPIENAPDPDIDSRFKGYMYLYIVVIIVTDGVYRAAGKPARKP